VIVLGDLNDTSMRRPLRSCTTHPGSEIATAGYEQPTRATGPACGTLPLASLRGAPLADLPWPARAHRPHPRLTRDH
jgi:hypothetical protein